MTSSNNAQETVVEPYGADEVSSVSAWEACSTINLVDLAGGLSARLGFI